MGASRGLLITGLWAVVVNGFSGLRRCSRGGMARVFRQYLPAGNWRGRDYVARKRVCQYGLRFGSATVLYRAAPALQAWLWLCSRRPELQFSGWCGRRMAAGIRYIAKRVSKKMLNSLKHASRPRPLWCIIPPTMNRTPYPSDLNDTE